MTDAEPRWLSDEDQHVWRQIIAVINMLPPRLERELQRTHGLSLHDYQILVQISEHPRQEVRLSDLAEATQQSKSRLSHQMTRMENAGLVARRNCPTDRRGAYAVLTEEGWEALRAAAPTHVESVREHLMDVMTPAQKQTVGEAFGAVAAKLRPAARAAVCPSTQEC
ncbi:MarR family transcriptional regulator [Embleya scabrispora]|uniref:MarR family transcriptional regulator n=1 Tax=Embleya scabrispora TaxID=159449 RepID=A0A1T3NW56_9ACTN|nr:MarR family transcriptional regulator [Embleya scabrispora]OPC81089.1 MarR family transcriptional regulator [Embleya scabrispora]